MGKKAVNEAERSQRIRAAIRLRLSGFSIGEIAEQMQLNYKTVDIYLNKGLKPFTEEEIKEYVSGFIKEAKQEKEIRDAELYKILFSGSPKEKIMAARELRENDKTIFDILIKTGHIQTVPDKLEVKTDNIWDEKKAFDKFILGKKDEAELKSDNILI